MACVRDVNSNADDAVAVFNKIITILVDAGKPEYADMLEYQIIHYI